jgi:hypothetical protein
MRIPAQARLPLTWLTLSAITLMSWEIGVRHGHGALQPNAVVSLSVILIAAFKVRMIFRQFMDVRHAPVLLRRLTDAWLGLMVVGLVAAYLVGAGAR